MTRESWLFPIHFKSDIREDVSIDDKRLKLRRITNKEILEFFKITVTERDEDGLIRKFSAESVGIFIDPLSAFLINHRFFVMSSQFILEAKEIECIKWFQQALKLHKDGKTGVFFGVNSRIHEFHFLHPIPFYGKKTYSLKQYDVTKLKELYRIIKQTRNKLYDLIIEKFLFALSGRGIRNEHRFLELVTILEMLYSPKGARMELSFRCSLRASKVLSKYLSMDEEKIYEDIRKIYDIRSGISHSGFHRDTAKYLNKLVDYTRKSIVLFLKDNSIFEDEKLDELCIKNWNSRTSHPE